MVGDVAGRPSGSPASSDGEGDLDAVGKLGPDRDVIITSLCLHPDGDLRTAQLEEKLRASHSPTDSSLFSILNIKKQKATNGQKTPKSKTDNFEAIWSFFSFPFLPLSYAASVCFSICSSSVYLSPSVIPLSIHPSSIYPPCVICIHLSSYCQSSIFIYPSVSPLSIYYLY